MSENSTKRQIANRFTGRPCKSRYRMKYAFDTPTFSKELPGWDNPLREERPWIVPAECEATARREKTRGIETLVYKRVGLGYVQNDANQGPRYEVPLDSLVITFSFNFLGLEPGIITQMEIDPTFQIAAVHGCPSPA